MNSANKPVKLLNAAVIVASWVISSIFMTSSFSALSVSKASHPWTFSGGDRFRRHVADQYPDGGDAHRGIIWGVLGDKKGRLSVLFGSILLYSVANVANGMVGGENAIFWYMVWRFVAGLGLAGELGAGITLVSEVLPKEKRGIGTMIVASVGISGAVAAYFVSEYFGDNWRICYYIGGASAGVADPSDQRGGIRHV